MINVVGWPYCWHSYYAISIGYLILSHIKKFWLFISTLAKPTDSVEVFMRDL